MLSNFEDEAKVPMELLDIKDIISKKLSDQEVHRKFIQDNFFTKMKQSQKYSITTDIQN